MKILSWNLNHRATMKTIPVSVAEVIRKFSADIVVLNEYTDGEARRDFKSALRKAGYGSILISKKEGRANQILIASKINVESGNIAAPDFDKSSRTNFLHVEVASTGLGVVGLRCPAYKSGSDLARYWGQLRTIIDRAASREILFIGDFNGDPDGKNSIAGSNLRELRALGWSIPAPDGEWSYTSHDGKRRSRLDHVAASHGVTVLSAGYAHRMHEFVLADSRDSRPISDHAALLVEIAD